MLLVQCRQGEETLCTVDLLIVDVLVVDAIRLPLVVLMLVKVSVDVVEVTETVDIVLVDNVGLTIDVEPVDEMVLVDDMLDEAEMLKRQEGIET